MNNIQNGLIREGILYSVEPNLGEQCEGCYFEYSDCNFCDATNEEIYKCVGKITNYLLQWHKYPDERPKDKSVVIAALKGGNSMEGFYSKESFYDNDKSKIDNVVAWMEYPKYNEE